MKQTDKSVTYQQIRTSLSIGMGQVYKIFQEHSTVRKLCTRWLPHNLTAAQKLRRVSWCREMMQRFADGDSSAVDNVLHVTKAGITVTIPKPIESVLNENFEENGFSEAEEAVASHGKAAKATHKFEWVKRFSQWFYRMKRCSPGLVFDSDPSYTFNSNVVPTFVFDRSLVFNFAPGLAFDSDPDPVLDSNFCLAFNSDSATNHSSDLNEAGN
ncbi:hypothetical protein EVAR_85428_1 [Eumeta japonica]|uniref:Mariner Mos1 transposase n=1 Tax=Eumeta variegata TaxID=151549 RepID=A0A4C1WM75_EUMVA|nr:hypothetical protein EVAR_85428_1 [Eumeta japonica]